MEASSNTRKAKFPEENLFTAAKYINMQTIFDFCFLHRFSQNGKHYFKINLSIFSQYQEQIYYNSKLPPIPPYFFFKFLCMFLITQSLGQSLIPHYACDMAYTKAIKMPVFWTDSCVIIMVFNDYNCLYVPCSPGCSIYHEIKFYFDSIYVLNIKCFQTNTIVRLIIKT